MQHPGLQILHQQLEQLPKLGVGQGVRVDGGQHLQELLAFGLVVGIPPGNGERLTQSRAFDTRDEAHAQNAYEKVRREVNPQSAREMRDAWVE